MNRKSKLFKLVFSSMIVAGAVAFAGILGNGAGATCTVTATPQVVSGLVANKVSVYNAASTNTVVYALVNCTTGTLAAAVSGGTAVPIPGGSSFTFDTLGKATITSVALQSASSTNTVYVGSF